MNKDSHDFPNYKLLASLTWRSRLPRSSPFIKLESLDFLETTNKKLYTYQLLSDSGYRGLSHGVIRR